MSSLNPTIDPRSIGLSSNDLQPQTWFEHIIEEVPEFPTVICLQNIRNSPVREDPDNSAMRLCFRLSTLPLERRHARTVIAHVQHIPIRVVLGTNLHITQQQQHTDTQIKHTMT